MTLTSRAIPAARASEVILRELVSVGRWPHHGGERAGVDHALDGPGLRAGGEDALRRREQAVVLALRRDLAVTCVGAEVRSDMKNTQAASKGRVITAVCGISQIGLEQVNPIRRHSFEEVDLVCPRRVAYAAVHSITMLQQILDDVTPDIAGCACDRNRPILRPINRGHVAQA